MAIDASPGALPEYRVLIPDPGWEGDSTVSQEQLTETVRI